MLRLFFSLYILVVLLFFVGSQIAENSIVSLHTEELDEDLARDFRVLYLLLEELQPRLDSEELELLFEKIRRQSNIPIEIRAAGAWNLKENLNKLSQEGDVYVEDFEDSLLYMRIKADKVIKIGPIKTIQSVEVLPAYIHLMTLIFIGITTLAWAAWQQYKIRCLTQETRRFSEGKLDTRAPMGFTAVPDLSQGFNIMAERIERLFLSHKHLTNAVSHELRSPITRARFQLELFDHQLSNIASNAQSNGIDQCHQLLKDLSENLDDMDGLVDEMLRYAKMERSEFLPNIERIELVEWLDSQRSYLQGETSKPLSTHCDPVPVYAYCDPTMLSRLLRNLISNADRHANNSILIDLRQDRGKIVLTVEDDGPGIPEEKVKNIFEPFVRLDESRNRDTGGYGLGLAIAAQIVRCHEGSITVERSVLGGAKFIGSWPQNRDKTYT